jgi:hypothetical protein
MSTSPELSTNPASPNIGLAPLMELVDERWFDT